MKVIKMLSVLVLSIMLGSCAKQGATKEDLKTEVDSVSYAIGLDLASKLKTNFSEVDYNLVIQGIQNGKDSSNVLIDENVASKVLRSYFQKKQMEAMAKRREEAEKKAEETYGDVKKAGEEFLKENKTKEGVKTTASGLQYKVLKEGDGEKPTATSKVKILYKGTLTDGTVFDSREDKDKPLEMMASQFVKGFTEGLQLMPVGSKYKFFIPQELGYGAFPRGKTIKPFSPLIFEVELLGVENPDTTKK
ncbi:MAG TPA: FKBP-type peptidyl-prolyl cis-trans isomerase [Flavobacteriaceae bacterium]|nr:FKBP-type peptidyl-prolyl cis-trans isomerase [Flavobacteriaceae bacterium]